MSTICNRLVPTYDEGKMDMKKLHLRSAASEYFLAQAELAIAAYNLEQFGASRETIIHLKSTKEHLSQVVKNYSRAISLLQPERISQDSLVWLKNFDYDRFYKQEIGKSFLSNRADLWNLIANHNRQGNPVRSLLIFQDQLISIINTLGDALVQTDSPSLVKFVRKALGDFADSQVFSVMLAVLNDVEPLDQHWVANKEASSCEKLEEVKA